MRDFTHLSRKECLLEYKNVMDNANAKFAAADTIAQREDFGTAISLQIVGLEETIKAFILFIDGKGFDFRKVKGMKSIFENHGLRYLFSFFMFSFSVFGGLLTMFFRLSMKEFKTKGIEETDKNMSEKSIEILVFQKVGPFLIKKIKYIFTELEWYKDFDKIRQNGFYSGYDNQLLNPLKTEKDYYLNVKKRIDVVKNVIQQIITELNENDEFSNRMLQMNLKSFKEKQIYQGLEWLIDYTKKNKMSGLDIITTELGNLIPDFEESILEKKKLVDSSLAKD